MFIRTQRLFLRPAWREDAPDLGRLLNDPEYHLTMSGTPLLETIADADQFLTPVSASHEARLLIFRRTETAPKLIGAAGLGRSFRRNELALWLARTERRHGYAQEAGNALLELAFVGLQYDNLWAPAFKAGPAARFLSRLGFHLPHADAASAILTADEWSQCNTPMIAA